MTIIVIFKTLKKMKKKYILEQSTSVEKPDMQRAFNLGCFKVYTSFKDLKLGQYKKTGDFYVIGTNRSGDRIVFNDDYYVRNLNPDKYENGEPKKKKWSCSALVASINPSADTKKLTKDQEYRIDQIIKQDEKYIKELPNDYQPDQYEEIDLFTRDRTMFPEKGKFKIYKKKGEFQQVSDAAQPIIDKLSGASYISIACETANADPDTYSNVINLKTKYPKVFNTDYCMALKMDNEVENLGDWSKYVDDNYNDLLKSRTNPNKKTCRTLINGYSDAMTKQKKVTNRNKIPIIQEYIQSCDRNFKFSFGTKTNLEKIMSSRKSTSGYYGINEETLSKILKNSLNELKESKKSILIERRIVKNRFNLILENKNNLKSTTVVFSKIINEIVILKRSGISDVVISEQLSGFFDMLKGVFGGNSASSNIMGGLGGTFVEYAAKFVIKFMGLDPSSPVARLFITAIGNVGSFADIPKILTDCNFTSQLLAKSVVESMAGSFIDNNIGSGILASAVRNILTDVAFNTDFVKAIQSKISEKVCEAIGKISDKADNVTKDIKTKALSK